MTRLLIPPNSAQRRSRWRKIVGLSFVSVAGLSVMLYGCPERNTESPEDRLRYVLAIKDVPASVRRLKASEGVSGSSRTSIYIELDKKDFEQLLPGRKLQLTGRKDITVNLSEFGPGLPARSANELYETMEANPYVSLETDKSHTWAHIVYYILD